MSILRDDQWPLMRVLAWCLWASDKGYHDEFIAAEGDDWFSIDPPRFQAWVRASEAEQLDPPTLADALMDLWVYLQRGRIAAWGQKDGGDVWEAIPANCWTLGSRLIGLSRLVAGENSYDRLWLSKPEVLRQRPEGGVQTALTLQLHHDPDTEFSKSHWDLRTAMQWVLVRAYPDPDVYGIFDPSQPVTTAERTRSALNALTEAFHSGSVIANGSVSVSSSPMQIREVEWPRLHIAEDEYGDIVLRRRDGTTAFVDISVDPLAMKAAWPNDASLTDNVSDELEINSTGLPGRPSKSWHLIDPEFKRHIANGALASSAAEEAERLVQWLRNAHPKAARPEPKTVKNKIAAEYRAAMKRPK